MEKKVQEEDTSQDEKEESKKDEKEESFWTSLKEDLKIDRKLIPIKIVIFLFNGGLLAFLPFLTLHMLQLGITVQEVAVMYALLPCCALMGPPVMGLIADRLGRYRLILNVTIFFGGLLHTLLLFVPPAPLGPAVMRCTPSGYEIVRGNCDACLLQANGTDVDLVMEDCHYRCDGVRRPLSGLDGVLCFKSSNKSLCIQVPYEETMNISGTLFLYQPNRYHCSFVVRSKKFILKNITQDVLGVDSFDDLMCPLDADSELFKNSITPEEFLKLDTFSGEYSEDASIWDELKSVEAEDDLLMKKNTLDARAKKSRTESIAVKKKLFPEDSETSSRASIVDTLDSTTFNSDTGSITVTDTPESTTFEVDIGTTTATDTTTAAIVTVTTATDTNTAITAITTSPATEVETILTDSSDRHTRVSLDENSHESFAEASSYVMNKCRLRCRVRGAPSCTTREGGSRTRTLIIYFLLRGFAGFSIAASFTMMDATTLTLMKQHKGDFGKQRAVNMVAYAIVPAFAGLLMDYESTAKRMDFTPLFIVSDVLFALSIICISNMNIQVVIPKDRLLDNLKALLTRGEINVFLILVCILGMNFGYIESYLFVYLKSMKATGFLLGITITVGAGVSFPILIWADKIVLKLGRHVIFITSFLVYIVRMVGYSLITNPWMCLPFEALEIFTYQLMWVATATFCSVMAPPGMLATTIGLIGCMHYSIGRGLGAFLGGYVITKIGMRRTFRVFGMMALGGAVLYAIVHYCYLKRKIREREEEARRLEMEQQPRPLSHYSRSLLNSVAAMTSSRASFTMVNSAPVDSEHERSLDSDEEDDEDYEPMARNNMFTLRSINSTVSMPVFTNLRLMFTENRSNPSLHSNPTSACGTPTLHRSQLAMHRSLREKRNKSAEDISSDESKLLSSEKLSADIYSNAAEDVSEPFNKPAKEGAPELSTISE